MCKTNKYFTIQQKKDLALSGKNVPICVNSTNLKTQFIAKIRNCIFDDTLKSKRFSI